LLEYDLQYQLRQALKAQCLVDFIDEMTPTKDEKKQEELPWALFVDGVGSSGLRIIKKGGLN